MNWAARLVLRFRPSSIAPALLVVVPLIFACGGDSTVPASEGPTGRADLAVRTPEGWDAPINYDSAAMSIGVAWANRGSGMAEDYAIILLADGQVIYRWEKPLLAPGSERTEVLELHELPDPRFLSPGPHEFELVVDPNRSVAESNEENNRYLTGVVDVVLPDLSPGAPAGMGWDGAVIFGGGDLVYGNVRDPSDRNLYLAYGVTNTGAIPANSWGRGDTVEVNGREISTRLFEMTGDKAAAPGQVSVNAIPVWLLALFGDPLLTGPNKVAIAIDVGNTVIEIDEADNWISLTVNLPPTRTRTHIRQHQRSSSADGPTVHPVYAVPADGADEEWDINGVIAGIVADMQSWLRQRTDGRDLAFDEDGDGLAVTFVQLERSRAEIGGSAAPWHPLVKELYERGLSDPLRVYAVWVPFAPRIDAEPICGVQTDYMGVKFALSFYERSGPGEYRCINQPTTMVHEVVHALGAVAPCAPNYYTESGTGNIGHVDDHANDLLYGGEKLGSPMLLDEGNDDYFMHGVPGCPDIADSPYLRPAR